MTASATQAELAAALLGELEHDAREVVMRRAVAALSRAVRDPAGQVRDPVDRRAAPARGPSGPLELRPRERAVALPLDDRAAATLDPYRVIVRGASRDARSRLEFSTRAPSARGAVAAHLGDPAVSVSATNELDPSDRFSWIPGGRACRCTTGVFAGETRGGELDDEGGCRECGLDVLPPRGVGIRLGRRRRRSLRRRSARSVT